jgi:hypothetical protein
MLLVSGACAANGTIDTGSVNGLAIDATHVYWGDLRYDGTYVKKAPLAGGSETTLANVETPEVAFVAGNQVYWRGSTVDGIDPTFFAIATDGGSPTVIVPETVYAVASNGTTVAWVHFTGTGKNGLEVVPVGGGAPTTIAQLAGVPDNLAMDDTAVYAAISSSIVRVSLADGSQSVLFSDSTLLGVKLAVDGANVYWIEGGDVRQIAKTGGAPTTLASRPGTGTGTAIAVDATHVYWNIGGEIGRAPIGGGVNELVATNAAMNLLAVNDKFICWAGAGKDSSNASVAGPIYALPK